MLVRRVLPLFALLALSEAAIAGTPVAVPEPETLALLAIGAAAVVVARWLKKK
jgi:hypothetical protein